MLRETRARLRFNFTSAGCLNYPCRTPGIRLPDLMKAREYLGYREKTTREGEL